MSKQYTNYLYVHTCYVCNVASKAKTVTTDHMYSHMGRGIFELNVLAAAASRFSTAVFAISLRSHSRSRLVMCHMSVVRCQVSGVTCDVSLHLIFLILFWQSGDLIDGGYVVKEATLSSLSTSPRIEQRLASLVHNYFCLCWISTPSPPPPWLKLFCAQTPYQLSCIIKTFFTIPPHPP